ncbi:response regulator transcription factor [Cronobacter dublinensis]|uniref:C4-dicarboxylate transport transcriptional regulatory protein DctD n=2 Tax=Cronobacter TaxID=413496 RepID=K8AJ73_9ENTR|nr:MULTISPECIES: response regulator [Cronobacter]EGT5713500.1 response regulator [Cronobacter dublinensis subsp. dublinensis]CCJ82413.1 C4-dicarboxylate transport transcriptional regulatory protein DctD [Cronobacter dublinensis 1210]ALB64899.1 histidine kinase [Cronobacter condimenti 1330]ALB68921.1 histidine kinase [Cronobacter dublinensis subsp. dublinensis LMG 23823]EGT5738517.1 response regulator [Cronobacter dublinensis subsp. dublinensis]
MTLPQRIAIVDDERSVRNGLCNLLQSDGYLTDAFDSAEAFLSSETALDTACVIIVDIKLKGMNGLTLFEKLKILPTPPPPVIFITGHGDENMQRYAESLGAVAFLRKPINVDVLLGHIQRVLSGG